MIAVDAKAAKESLVTVCSTLGMRLDTRIVKEKMTARNGCMALCGTPWTQSFFETVRYLSEQEQERYTHLSDKLTIAFLCKQFSLSPTFLKEGFRRAYGMPIHSFLVQQRLRRAQELICTTRMPSSGSMA